MGCSTRTVIAPIDPRLTMDCKQPVLMGNTWRDVGVLATEQKAALEECTTRMREIKSISNQ